MFLFVLADSKKSMAYDDEYKNKEDEEAEGGTVPEEGLPEADEYDDDEDNEEEENAEEGYE